MGLIQAGRTAVGTVFADQWREYFYCDSLDEDTLVAKGQKRISDRSSNVKGSDNIISNGSVIAVNEGQCMIIVDQGKVAEFCAMSGEFRYDSSTEPSLFSGNLGTSIIDTFKAIGRRFTFGGDTGKDQRVYYFNTKEIVGNKYGTANAVPFRVVDNNIGLDVDIAIRCFGEYSYRIIDPILFYTNVSGNVDSTYTRDRLDSQLKSELLDALQPTFAKISAMGIRYSALPGHTTEMSNALNEVLSTKWSQIRGIQIASFGISSVKASEEDEKLIKDLQRAAVLRNPNMAAATLVSAQSEAMVDAANNPGGAMMAFAGMGMAQQAGGATASNLFAMGQQQQAQGQGQAQAAPAQPAAAPAEGGWTCPSCGKACTGKFCTECGAKMPVNGWTCECGSVNKGMFCPECGKKKPAGALLYKCDKCGWEPKDPTKPPKFCPECGDIFNEDDISNKK